MAIAFDSHNYRQRSCRECPKALKKIAGVKEVPHALMCKTLIGSNLLFSHARMVANTVPEFSVTLTHTAGTCPVYDSEAMKKFQELSKEREAAAKRLGVKIISKWSPTRVHRTQWIIEAPTRKAAEDYFKAVGLAIWNEIEVQEVKMI